MANRRSSDSLRRRPAVRNRRPRLLICCEGKVTEPEYFEGVIRCLRAVPVDVVRCEVKGVGCDPLKVVQEAEVRWQRDKRRYGADAYDQVWCVVDRDDHPSLNDAVKFARKAGIDLALSVPSFDYWLLLHFTEHRRHSTVEQIERALRRHIVGYDKHLPESFPFECHTEAEARARAAAPNHDASNVVGPNPSTNVWLVVRAVQAVSPSR
jgi:hypothetical protein